ncbi:conserved hypothetical protein [Paecilomyces variotii No. 5]|uniref:DNA endonuclease activator Ctp1 C-terminal domain-containing protein n=1 Tax=Byssochlamys spectabilis (strain No. 5 / NBRC 109023) TaxID=1356009 RepID=V5G8U1_BYSSN|nr:conserved hypothetical protein [Paecilomyces variotii No. 5]
MDVIRNIQFRLADQLDETFSRAYNELNAELAARDARINEAEEKARVAEEARVKTVKQAEELQRENEWFQRTFWTDPIDNDEQGSSAAISNDIKMAYNPANIIDISEGDLTDKNGTELLEAHYSLRTKYRSLYDQVQELAAVSDTLRRKVKQAKEKLSLWQEHFNRDQFTVPVQGKNVTFKRTEQAGERNRGSRSSSRRIPQASPSPHTRKSDLTNMPHPQRSVSHLFSIPNSSRAVSGIKIERDEDQLDLSLLQPSDSTQTASQSSVIEEPNQRDGNSTVAMIATPVKSNTTADPALPRIYSRETMETGTYERPAVIKSEQSTSSELDSLLNCHESGPPGTQDLEDIGKTVETPRKHVHWDNELHGPSAWRVFHDSGSRKSTFGGDIRETRAQQKGRQMPLQPVDANKTITSHSGPEPAFKRRKSGRRGEHAIPSVAEDGEENYAKAVSERTQRMTGTPVSKTGPLAEGSASTKRRLDDLLAAPSPQRSPLVPHKFQRAPGGVTNRLPRDANGTERNADPVHNAQPFSRGSTTAQGSSYRSHGRRSSPSRHRSHNDDHSPEPPDPEDEPFRCRPVHRLTLDCFKINSEYNHGLDFAFDEVVRKKDQRRYLAGCTRPDCCGDKFRAMARAGGLTSTDDEDRQILEDYMGDQRHKLSTMGEDEKHDILIEARARLLANQYGKHRYTHERPRSPPGFWRTDMPSTQELEQDQEDARKLEREKVMERYREAMRPGGIWRFADEP